MAYSGSSLPTRAAQSRIGSSLRLPFPTGSPPSPATCSPASTSSIGRTKMPSCLRGSAGSFANALVARVRATPPTSRGDRRPRSRRETEPAQNNDLFDQGIQTPRIIELVDVEIDPSRLGGGGCGPKIDRRRPDAGHVRVNREPGNVGVAQGVEKPVCRHASVARYSPAGSDLRGSNDPVLGSTGHRYALVVPGHRRSRAGIDVGDGSRT